jgi:ABC-2 type transport system ATP-binding protein
MAIRVENLSKTYGTQKAVDNISFEIPKGQIVGFLGPNGAGKSTTMKMLTGYLTPTSGSAFICDLNILEKPLLSRSKLGYLPEHNPLYDDMYIREYLLFMAELNKVKKPKQKVEEIIALTDLTLERNKKIGILSKGYRQRVGLAQALIHDPEVLILDEPTSGFDPNQIAEIRTVIKNISAQKTIMLSTHIMQEVEALCERTIIINFGKIVADAPTKNLEKLLPNETCLFVAFSVPIQKEQLINLPGVSNVKTTDKPNTWRIYTQTPDACKPALTKLVVAKDGYIIEQKEEKQSLEDIFQKLTKHVDTL